MDRKLSISSFSRSKRHSRSLSQFISHHIEVLNNIDFCNLSSSAGWSPKHSIVYWLDNCVTYSIVYLLSPFTGLLRSIVIEPAVSLVLLSDQSFLLVIHANCISFLDLVSEQIDSFVDLDSSEWEITAAVVTPEKKIILSASSVNDSDNFQLFHFNSNNDNEWEFSPFLQDCGGPISDMCCTENTLCLSQTDSRQIRLFQLVSGTELPEIQFELENWAPRSLVADNQGHLLISLVQLPLIVQIELETGRIVRQIPLPVASATSISFIFDPSALCEQLLVTTSSSSLSGSQLASFPLSGCILRLTGLDLQPNVANATTLDIPIPTQISKTIITRELRVPVITSFISLEDAVSNLNYVKESKEPRSIHKNDSILFHHRWLAAQRHLETERLDALPKINDMFAQYLVGDLLESVSSIVPSIIDRARWIDKFIISTVASGVTQVVFVGCGFETRHYRLPLPENASLFLLDEEQIAIARDAALKSSKPVFAGRSTVIHANIETDSQWISKLIECSHYNAEEPTIWVFEDIFPYLEEDRVSSIISSIATLSCSGSLLVADLINTKYLEVVEKLDITQTRGLTWRFGCDNPGGLFGNFNFATQLIELNVNGESQPFSSKRAKKIMKPYLVSAVLQK